MSDTRSFFDTATSFFRKKEIGITPRKIELLRKDKADELSKILDVETANTATLCEESLTHVRDRTESTIWIRRHKAILALAIDRQSYNVIRALGNFVHNIQKVCLVETFIAQGILTESQMKKTGFKSRQVLEMSLEEYFRSWVKSQQKLLFTKRPEDYQKRVNCEQTIRAVKETFKLNLNEFD